MKPRTPDVNKELLKQATGALYLITDPRSDVYLEKHKNEQRLSSTRRLV
ncbi:hypothetical protein [Cyanophage S-TIM5]|uniref:Uncharacterized protein n=1 Tax=Cyanophage S-TIM5 TaxID=1137745 RepID=A0ACD4B0X3_9CAUD|nr:hypothetical protein F417_gp090 [Cyanophage S-TIM5]UTS51908.1 hypothetical protein [Cyanophage S-TIM5]UYE96890.1 hypothetical protein [Cyanophage S-TIM66]UYE97102.1 hypothetical protein [Cyanophage S-TIM61]